MPLSHTSKTLSGTGFNNNNISHDNTTVNSSNMQVGAKNTTTNKKAEEQFSVERNANWDTSRVGSVLKSTKSLTDIIEKMRHDFGIPITTGNIRQRGALGMYGVKRQTIRSKNANDLPIIAHELGHHLDNIYKLTFDIGLAGDELVGGLDHEFKLQYAPEEYLGEGLAEFMRKYLQNTETAKIDYP